MSMAYWLCHAPLPLPKEMVLVCRPVNSRAVVH